MMNPKIIDALSAMAILAPAGSISNAFDKVHGNDDDDGFLPQFVTEFPREMVRHRLMKGMSARRG